MKKKCVCCKDVKMIYEFKHSVALYYADNRYNTCLDCLLIVMKLNNILDAKTRTCIYCGEEKDISQFKDKQTVSKHVCQSCRKKVSNIYWAGREQAEVQKKENEKKTKNLKVKFPDKDEKKEIKLLKDEFAKMKILIYQLQNEVILLKSK